MAEKFRATVGERVAGWGWALLLLGVGAAGCSGDEFTAEMQPANEPPMDDVPPDDMPPDDVPPDDVPPDDDQPPDDDVPPGGLDPSATLNTLTDAERNDLCRELRGAFDRGVDNQRFSQVVCTLSAWRNANGDLAACEAEYSTCIARDPQPRLSVVANVSCMEYAPLNDACVTVEQLETCYVDFGTAFELAFGQLRTNPRTCDEAQTNPPEEIGGEVLVTPPAGCAALSDQACGYMPP